MQVAHGRRIPPCGTFGPYFPRGIHVKVIFGALCSIPGFYCTGERKAEKANASTLNIFLTTRPVYQCEADARSWVRLSLCVSLHTDEVRDQ